MGLYRDYRVYVRYILGLYWDTEKKMETTVRFGFSRCGGLPQQASKSSRC